MPGEQGIWALALRMSPPLLDWPSCTPPMPPDAWYPAYPSHDPPYRPPLIVTYNTTAHSHFCRALWGSWGQSLASAVLDDEASPSASAPTHPKISFYFSHQASGAPDSGSDDGPGPQGSVYESCDRRPWGVRQGQRGNAAAGYAVPGAEANGGLAVGRGAEPAVNGTVPAGGRAHWVRAGAGRAGASMAAAAAGLAAGYAGGKGQEANGRMKHLMPRPVVTPLNVSVSGGPEVTPVLTQKWQEQRAAAAAQRLGSLGSRSISNAHESDR